mgnify:CR=1 FL=1
MLSQLLVMFGFFALVLVALFFVAINMIVDLLYFAIDPRLSVRA